ncbi:40S ribosomal protein S2 [Mucor ambiguus]|uniref:Small ribosomal subunit protein uS2 n=2 Tax=Mucor TaxID=4830 RepID=A0A0C9MIA6_9FUNG|nr:40S ribosomal protein S2 [Mucor ambiguus]
MVKFIKAGKVVVILQGRYAGKKAVVVRNHDEGTKDRPYGYAVVAGVERSPLKVTKAMGKKKTAKRSKVKPFVKIVNYNHMMPTRYGLELEQIKGTVSAETFKEPTQREDSKKVIKKLFEERYQTVLEPTEKDVALMLAAKCHLGTMNVSKRMKPYVFSRRADGIQIIHLGKTWEKLILAARVLAIVDPKTIYIAFSTTKTRRPAIKLAQYIGGKTNQERFMPGTFTNTWEEPFILVCMDPMTDFQAVQESSKCNMPVIAFTNTHCSLKYVDIAIPCNNMGAQSLGLMCWLLSRAILRLRGTLSYTAPWNVLADMFFYSDVQEEEEEGEYGQQQQAHPYEPMHKRIDWDASGTTATDKGEFRHDIHDTHVNWGQGIVVGDWADDVSQEQQHQFDSREISSTGWAGNIPGAQKEKEEPEEEGWGDAASAASKPFAPFKTPWDD